MLAALSQTLSAPAVHVPAGALATDRDGRAVAAVWSETAHGRARLVAAFATADGRFGPRHVLLRSRMPVTSLGVAATPGGGVAVVAARARGRRAGAILGLTADRAGAHAVRLGGGTLAGGPPAVAVDERGNVLAAWREPQRTFLARAAGGRWGRAVRAPGAVAEPAVAAGEEGAAMLVPLAHGRIELAR